jgi:hypothetical protein
VKEFLLENVAENSSAHKYMEVMSIHESIFSLENLKVFRALRFDEEISVLKEGE